MSKWIYPTVLTVCALWGAAKAETVNLPGDFPIKGSSNHALLFDEAGEHVTKCAERSKAIKSERPHVSPVNYSHRFIKELSWPKAKPSNIRYAHKAPKPKKETECKDDRGVLFMGDSGVVDSLASQIFPGFYFAGGGGDYSAAPPWFCLGSRSLSFTLACEKLAGPEHGKGSFATLREPIPVVEPWPKPPSPYIPASVPEMPTGPMVLIGGVALAYIRARQLRNGS